MFCWADQVLSLSSLNHKATLVRQSLPVKRMVSFLKFLELNLFTYLLPIARTFLFLLRQSGWFIDASTNCISELFWNKYTPSSFLFYYAYVYLHFLFSLFASKSCNGDLTSACRNEFSFQFENTIFIQRDSEPLFSFFLCFYWWTIFAEDKMRNNSANSHSTRT